MADFHIYFDNGLLSALLKSSKKDGFEKLNAQLDSSEISFNQNNILQTPFSVLELLGVRIKIKDLPFRVIDSSGIDYESINDCKKLIEAFFQSVDFQNLANTKSKFVHSSNNEFYWVYVSQLLNKGGFYDLLVKQTLFDRLCLLRYKKEDMINVFWIYFYPLLISNSARENNYSFFRLAVRFWNAIYESPKNGTTHLEYEMKDFHSFKTKEAKDFVDCELIHYVLSGFFYFPVYKPVAVFTMDDPINLKRRILYYKKFYQDVIERETKPHFAKLLKLHKEGVIYFVDKDYSIIERLDVSQIQLQ